MISVILPTFNNEKTIANSIRSIINQTYRDFELIIINDCSTDKTKKIIKSFNDKRIIYLENRRNLGGAGSRNIGIKKAKGDFIAMMDGDDVAIPRRLEIQFNYLKKNLNIDLVASNIIFFTNNKVSGLSDLRLYSPKKFRFYLRALGLPHPTWMARANFFKNFTYQSNIASEDYELLLRALEFSRYAVIKEPLLFYNVPISADIKYKLRLLYSGFLTRFDFIRRNRLYHFLPLIFIIFIVSSIFYIFSIKTYKTITKFNANFQKLFDKIIEQDDSSKRIVHIISSIKGGGAEVAVRNLHKINLNKNLDSYVIYFTGKFVKLEKNEMLLNMHRRNPLIIFYLRKKLKEFLKKQKKLVIHVHLTWPFIFTFFAVLGLKNIKLIYTEHDTTNRRRKIPFFRIIDRLIYSRYDSIVCISHGVHKALAKWVGPKIRDRIVTITNGSRILPLHKRSSIKNRPPRLISLGSLTYKKNFSTSIAAIAEIKDDIESYTIVGEGPERGKLQNLIKSLELEKKVKLVGWSDNIKKHLYKADIQIIPSLVEGFGLVAVEGMSTGLPIVASNVEGLKEVLGYQNPSVTLINKTRSIQSWKKGIQISINNLNNLGTEKISKFSRQQVLKFNFENMAKNYLKNY